MRRGEGTPPYGYVWVVSHKSSIPIHRMEPLYYLATFAQLSFRPTVRL